MKGHTASLPLFKHQAHYWFALISLFVALSTNSVNAAVLTFDDIVTLGDSSTHEITTPYGGLTWSNLRIINTNFHVGTGYENGTVSGDYVSFNAYGNPVIVQGSPFTFNGAYFTTAQQEDDLVIKIQGYSGSTKLYETTITPLFSAATWYNFNYVGIDTLIIIGSGPFVGSGSSRRFAMDNFTFNEPTPVPIPAAVWLFGSGLLGLIGVSRRK